MNSVATSERVHIAIFGNCNSGKSSLLNALVGQQIAVVSDVAGTTTDSVQKAVELPGVGAAVIIDTPGLDDSSTLSALRTAQSYQVLPKTDIAIVILPVAESFLSTLSSLEIPTIKIISKCDLSPAQTPTDSSVIAISSTTGEGLDALREQIARSIESTERLITEGLCDAGDTVLLVMPQDSSAPKGRLIKPQVETIRELLDRGCIVHCCQPAQLADALHSLATPPKAIITDSSAFAAVKPLVPQGTTLTSFSILFARYKGDLECFKQGAERLLTLPSDAKILIAEACSHTPQNEDIGRVKLPRLLRKKLGEGITITNVGGADFPDDLTDYDLIIHCGACMFNRRYVLSRIAAAKAQDVPMTNYGVAIAALLNMDLDL